MKPTSTFKMSGTSKRLLALLPFTDSEQRNAYKRMLIEAQLSASVRPARTKGNKQDKSDE